MNELQQRWNAPTPPFFKKVQYIGMILGAVGGSLLAAPVALPAMVITVAGYAVVAGTVLATLSQVAVDQPGQGFPIDHWPDLPHHVGNKAKW
ncbi:hypothetical protein [Litoribacter populi]|uniref:hypothetical protein n=1 Tax=Litoribacter populi TaxID=2598460 RepID=UPI001F31F9BC|nr:hypothetical protein [Litoribacter populi]